MRSMMMWLLIALLAVTGGCFRVNVDADSYVDKYAGPYVGGPANTGEEEAVEEAIRVARQEGADVDGYDLSNRKVGQDWWVLFDQRDTPPGRKWPVHFSVRVTPDGKGQLYKDR